MSNSKQERKWPVKSFKRRELDDFNGNGLALYWSDPDRVDFGEMMFHKTAMMIPFWVKPNTLTRCGLFFNICIFLISFAITPAIDKEMGESAAKWVPSLICIIMAMLQITVSALDNWDGLHARGTSQCSDLGALLDHYFDSISIAMNSIAMTLLFNSIPFCCVIGVITGPMIFNMQLLINHYLKQEPRVMGPEAQMMCATIDIITAFLFYYQLHDICMYISYIAAMASLCILLGYIIKFVPKFIGNPTILSQLFVFWASYGILCVVYWNGWISTFELCISGVWISWDFNGQIVTHDICKEQLPIFKPYYFIIPIGVIIEYHYFNPLLWIVDSKNNIHFTTLIIWSSMVYKNMKHHVSMQNKLLYKKKEKKPTNMSG